MLPKVEDTVKTNDVKEEEIKIENKLLDTEPRITESLDGYPCIECKKIFKRLSDLSSHKSRVHKIQVTVCEYCCKEFKNGHYYKKHVQRLHEVHSNERIPCDMCDKTFKSKNNLYHHKKAVHETGESICYLCAKVYKNIQALRKHLPKCETKTSKGPKPDVVSMYSENILVDGNQFICKICGKSKSRLNLLTTHIKVVHTHERVPCHLCHQQLKNVDYLKKHYKVKHFVVDIETINEYVKIVVPEHRDKRKGKKYKPSITNNSLKQERDKLVRKWREMEEQRKLEEESIKGDTTNAVSNTDIITTIEKQNVMKDKNPILNTENTTSTDVKSEDDDCILECKVKLEASDDSAEELDEQFALSISDDKVNHHSLSNCTKKEDGQFKKDTKSLELDDHLNLQKISGTLVQENVKTESVEEQPCHSKCPTFGTELTERPKKNTKNTLTNCQCPNCGKTFEGSLKLKNHIRRVHTFGSFLCPECGKEFISKQQLKNHKENHHTAAKQCGYCQKIVKNLNVHIKDMHTDEQAICPDCAKTFRSSRQLRDHRLKVHAQADKATFCPVCARSFANSHYMKKHLRLVHGNMENSVQVECNECGKLFANTAYLQHHIKKCHEIENSICEMCNGSYKNKRALQRHIRYAHREKATNDEHGDLMSPICKPLVAVSPEKSPNTNNSISLSQNLSDSQNSFYSEKNIGSGQYSSFPMDFSTNHLNFSREHHWQK